MDGWYERLLVRTPNKHFYSLSRIMTRIRRGTLTNASVAILAPMSFDSNTDLWKHTSHFVRRPSSLLFEIIGSVDYLETSERRRARRKFLLQESPTSHIATFHEASSLGAGRSFLKFGCMRRLKNDQWTNFKIVRDCKLRPSDTFLTYFSRTWVLKTRQIEKKTEKFRKSQKIQKIKTIPKM